jgi:uncharacterized protein (TIGR02453 family)
MPSDATRRDDGEQADCLPRASLSFLRDLAAHNDRDWFSASADRCRRDLIEPARALVRRLSAGLQADVPQITGSDKPTGGSLTRLHRDTRFSRDKCPFHTHIGMHFWHRSGTRMEVPGFFLRIDPSEVLLATGLHQPEPAALERLRRAIDRDPDGWMRASRNAAFVRRWNGLEGESLKRVPAPWPADHPLADDLRRKDFTAFVRLSAATATKPGFAKTALAHWKASGPLIAFICRALGLPF